METMLVLRSIFLKMETTPIKNCSNSCLRTNLRFFFFICLFITQVVAIKAVNVLCTMAEASGSFMQRRVIKDAIPSMTKFLEKQAPVSIKAGPVYSQSQAFKLQLTMLKSLGRLCRQLEISDANLSSVVWVCSQYLSCRQPSELQQVSEIKIGVTEVAAVFSRNRTRGLQK